MASLTHTPPPPETPPDGASRTAAASDRFVDNYLAYLLALASHLVSRQFHAQLGPKGVAVPVWRVLATLSDGDGMTIGALARAVLFKQPTLTKVLDRLEADGLVERRPDAEDRRRVLVFITPKGRTLIDGLLIEAKRHEAAVLAGYTPAEEAALKQVLRTLIDRCEAGGE